MTGATSTTGGGGGAAARTLPLLQPKVVSRSTALTKAPDICFMSFPSIESLNFYFNRVTGAPESKRCSVEGKCVPRVVFFVSGASVTRLHFLLEKLFLRRKVSCLAEQLNSLCVTNANRIPGPNDAK
jgi:hypothetical protein